MGTVVTIQAPLVPLRAQPNKLDLLFMIDNSIGMADEQAMLARALPRFLERIVTPRCVDANGTPVGVNATPECPAGSAAEFDAPDLHVGVITSSLGDHGSGDVCSDAQNNANMAAGSPRMDYDDHAQLLPSVRSGLGDKDFLAWDPWTGDAQQLTDDLVNQVQAVGERGCGYESQMESWYRFLVDPEPVASMSNDGSTSVRGDVNDTVLAQRAAFLRPDSVLTIVMLTNENDCSIMDEDGQQGWLAGYKGGVGKAGFHLPRATSACDADPSDPCCRACGTADADASGTGGTTGAEHCPPTDQDPNCQDGNFVTPNEDSMNQRCFHQKQRFGIDLLYPTLRYKDAINNVLITPRTGGPAVPNPLYGVDSFGNYQRVTNVILAGIVGVPWQDIATPESLTGDGLTFLTAEDLASQERYSELLGDPNRGVAPGEPFMEESIDPRPTGAPNPFVPGVSISPPDSTTLANPINGHEQEPLAVRDDLQFACTYQLANPVDCNNANADACDCNNDEFAKNSPLCTGVTAAKNGTQVYGKAYPGTRELDVLQSAQQQGVLASACPKTPSGTEADDPMAGYGPAVSAIADRVQSSFGNLCLPKPLPIANCAIVEARPNCTCNPDEGRVDPSGLSAEMAGDMASQLSSAGLDPANYCFCEIPMLKGAELDSCRNSSVPDGAGFCYLESGQDNVNPALLASCVGDTKARLRFVGKDLPAADSLLALECTTGL